MIYVHTLNPSCTLQTALIKMQPLIVKKAITLAPIHDQKQKILHFFNIIIVSSACPKWFGTSSENGSVIDSCYLKNDP